MSVSKLQKIINERLKRVQRYPDFDFSNKIMTSEFIKTRGNPHTLESSIK